MSKQSPDFVVEAVDENDGARTVLYESDSSADARDFMRRYVSRENAGGWALIEVYDVRGDDADRIAFWARDAA